MHRRSVGIGALVALLLIAATLWMTLVAPGLSEPGGDSIDPSSSASPNWATAGGRGVDAGVAPPTGAAAGTPPPGVLPQPVPSGPPLPPLRFVVDAADAPEGATVSVAVVDSHLQLQWQGVVPFGREQTVRRTWSYSCRVLAIPRRVWAPADVEVPAGHDGVVTLRLDKGGSITGVVTDASGRPVARGTVRVAIPVGIPGTVNRNRRGKRRRFRRMQVDEHGSVIRDGHVLRSVATDAEGRFQFDGVPWKPVRVEAGEGESRVAKSATAGAHVQLTLSR